MRSASVPALFSKDSVTIAEIESYCSANNLLFTDPDFNTCVESLYQKSAGVMVSASQPICWRRPNEFMKQEFQVFSKIEPSDIEQGGLGDCWFLCVLASLAEFPGLIEGLFVPESRKVSPGGVYRMRFCKNGQWQYVTVDDFFPCKIGKGPIFSRAKGPELWVLLLEKAFAKLHGSYEAIRAGIAYEAMMDLTGAPYEKIVFSVPECQQAISDGSLFNKLKEYDSKGYIMSLSTPGENMRPENEKNNLDSGLVFGHAYTLLGVLTTSNGDKLLRIRNPWGAGEWNGDWSDHSAKWNDSLRLEMGCSSENDGVFFMCMEDVVKNFTSINVCFCKGHTDQSRVPWIEQRRKSVFHYDGSNVGTRMYKLILQTRSDMIFSIHQQDYRIIGNKTYIDIGVTVLKLTSDGSYNLVVSSGISVDRQNQTAQVTLDSGEYIVVPVSTGCHFEFAENNSQNSSTPTRLLTSTGELTPDAVKVLNEIFIRYDLDLDNGLVCNEFCDLNSTLKRRTFTEAEYQSEILAHFDSLDGALTKDGFRDWFMAYYKENGENMEEMWSAFEYMGYNRNLDLLYARSVILAIHSNSDFDMVPFAFDATIYEEAIELPVVKYGEVMSFADGNVKMYSHKGGLYGISFAVQNLYPFPVCFILDCTGSLNVISHRGNLVASLVIPPKETKVLHHLLPNKTGEWGWHRKLSMQKVA